MNLSDESVKMAFGHFLLNAIRESGMTVESLSARSNLSVKQLKRSYLPGCARPVNKIPEPTYQALLGTVKKTHDDFYQYYQTQLSQKNSTTVAAHTTSESPPSLLRDSYLHWVVNCHERLEYRGIQYSGGGKVSVELKQVYLALQADSRNPLERAATRESHISEIQTAIESGELSDSEIEHIEWRVIAASPIMPSFESRDRLGILDPTSKELLNLGEACYRESQLVILGDPGSGKTTLARWLTLVSAQGMLNGERQLHVKRSQVIPMATDNHQQISLGLTRIPILLRISEYADERQRQAEINGKPMTLLEFLGQQTWLGSVPQWTKGSPDYGKRIDTALLNQFFHETLLARQALIILDGLDEIPASNLRDEIVEEVNNFTEKWIRSRKTISKIHTEGSTATVFLNNLTGDSEGNRLLVTSRIAGYHANPLRGDLAHVTIEPMQEPAVALFIKNWMRAVHQALAPSNTLAQTTQAKADEQSEQLLNSLNSPHQRGGRELATNPLLCSILSSVFHQNGQQLPQQRVDLYQQAVELLLDIWIRKQRDDESSKLLRYELFDVLEPLAEHIHRHEPTGLIAEPQLHQLCLQFLAESRGENPLRPSVSLRKTVDEMIRVIKEDVGLIAARGEGVYGFLHLTFQEYFAARALVHSPISACNRITGQMGDARWREVIRLGLGSLCKQAPSHFLELAQQLLAQQTTHHDLLPRPALTLVGCLPDLHNTPVKLIELLIYQFVKSYARRDLLNKLPRRRKLLEWAIQYLVDSGTEKTVENSFINMLKNANNTPEIAAATAELMCQLNFYTPALLHELIIAQAQDLAEWKHPIHRALQLAMTDRDKTQEPSILPCAELLPFRQTLIDEPDLVKNIRQHYDWLRVVLVFYGGLDDYEVIESTDVYQRTSNFLQQVDASRNAYREAFLEQWGGADGDWIYNMAVYLDTEGGERYKLKKIKPVFNPEQIHRESALNEQIITALRNKAQPQSLCSEQSALKPHHPEFSLLTWALNLTDKNHAHLSHNSFLNARLRQLNDELADSVVRSGPILIDTLLSLNDTLCEEHWWILFEAAANTILSYGGEPLKINFPDVTSTMSSSLQSQLIAEAIASLIRGRNGHYGDTDSSCAQYLTTRLPGTANTLLLALSRLPLASHLCMPASRSDWTYEQLPPSDASIIKVPSVVLTNLMNIPSGYNDFRQWSLMTIIIPKLEEYPSLLPEMLVFALGLAGKSNCLNALYEIIAPEILTATHQPELIYQRIIALKDPYYRIRGLIRLSLFYPERQADLMHEAKDQAQHLSDPLQGAEIYEWLVSLSTLDNKQPLWQPLTRHIKNIDDPDEQARFWTRLGLMATFDESVSYFKCALNAVAKINNEFKKSTAIRLIRKATGEHPELANDFSTLISHFKDPIHKARATEQWGRVFHHLDQPLKTDSAHIEIWAILSLAAQANQHLNQNTLTTEQLWLQLAIQPSDKLVQQICQRSENDTLICTPLVVQCLDKLLKNEATHHVETLFPYLRAPAINTLSFFENQLHSLSPLIAAIAALLLAETEGLHSRVITGVMQCTALSKDAVRYRALALLNGGDNSSTKHRASLIGLQGLNQIITLATKKSATPGTYTNVSWFFERLCNDSPEIISEWSNKSEHEAAIRIDRETDRETGLTGLRLTQHYDKKAWDQTLIELGRGEHTTKNAILMSMARLAYKNCIKDPASLFNIMGNISDSEFLNHPIIFFTGEDICAAIIDNLKSPANQAESHTILKNIRQQLLARHTCSWREICNLPSSDALLAYLKKTGRIFYSIGHNETTRCEKAIELVKPGMEHPGFLEILCEWATETFNSNHENHSSTYYEKSYVYELLGGATSLAPFRLLKCPASNALRPALISAFNNSGFTVRSDSIRILGYLRHLTLDILPTLRNALCDVLPVREGAITGMYLFRKMDTGVLDEIKNWLFDDSEIIAYATAQLLTAIGLHAQSTRNLETGSSTTSTRQDIVDVLSQATSDPRSNRRLHFGDDNHYIPEVPLLCDFFYDCMLKVAGYDDKTSAC